MTDSADSPDRPSFAALAPEEEASLVMRLKKGDRSVMEALLAAYWGGLVRFALGILGDRDRAEDIVQEAFVCVWERRDKWKHSESLRPILYRIVRNRSLNENRRCATFVKWAQSFRHPESDATPGPLQALEESNLRAVVRNAVDSLPPRRREIFVLIRFHHFSYKEAAKALDLSPQTIANQMSQATQDLRSALGPYLTEDGDHQIPFPRAEAG